MSSGETTVRTMSTEPFAEEPPVPISSSNGNNAALPFALETQLYEESTSHGFGRQLAALLQRVWRQLWHDKTVLVLELCVPLLFIALLAVLDKAFGSEVTLANNTMTSWHGSYLLDSRGLSEYMCYADKAQPIPGLAYCPRSRQRYLCDGNESGLPVHGLCYNADAEEPMGIVALFMRSMLNTLLALPSLDSIILYQWLAKKAGSGAVTRGMTAIGALSNLGLGVSPNTRFDAIASSGLLYFAPAAAIPADFFPYLRSVSQLFPYVFGGTFDTEAEALDWFSAHSPDPLSRNSTWGLVLVHDITHSFDVEILLHGSAMPQVTTMAEIKYPGDYMYDGSDMYIASGYISLQRAFYDYFLTRQQAAGAIVTAYNPNKLYPFVTAVPHLDTNRRYLFDLTALLVAFITVLAFLYPFSRMVKRMVLEKELRMREAMLIMGVRKSALWASFFLSSLAENVLISVLCTLLLCLAVTVRSDPFAVFGVLMLYNTALVPLAGVVSTLFSKARLAALLTPLIYLVLSIPIFVMNGAEERVVLGLAALPPTAFATLMNNIATAENGPGFHRNHFRATLFFSPVPYKVMLVLAGDVVFYTLLLFYLDAVLPQEWGTRAHPLFFLRTPCRALGRATRRCCHAASRRMSRRTKWVANFTSDSLTDTLREDGATVAMMAMNNNNGPLVAGGTTLVVVSSAPGLSREEGTPMQQHRGAGEQGEGEEGEGEEEETVLGSAGTITRRTKRRESSARNGPVVHTCPASYVSNPAAALPSSSSSSSSTTNAAAAALVSDCFDPTIHLDPHTGLPKRVVVQLQHLRKSFRRDKALFAAVDDLSLSLYDGEVSVILGPNGAGKSTAINLMTGMLAPDGGDCFIDGRSVRHELAAARHMMGFCPQHNILWPDLTCRQHLEFFAKVKGVRGAALHRVVHEVLQTVDLLDKQDYTPPMLSGGQRRKLSVAIAFVGGGRVVFLDEPTAGMDVAARRHTWALIRAMSAHRAIVLTTHHMDEADLLGDHVALINRGRLQCAGSSLFLRSYGGASYTLHFDLLPFSFTPHHAEAAVMERIWRRLTRLVRGTIPEATVLLCTDCELDYGLPLARRQAIPSLLRRLEKQSNVQLGVRSYALVAPSLEDVFLRIVDGGSMINNAMNVAEGGGANGGQEEMNNSNINYNDAAAAAASNSGGGGNVRRPSMSLSALPSSPEVRRMSVGSYRFLNNDPGASAVMTAMLNSANELAFAQAAANQNNENDDEGSAVFAERPPRQQTTTANCLSEVNEQMMNDTLNGTATSFIQPVQAFAEGGQGECVTDNHTTPQKTLAGNDTLLAAACQDPMRAAELSGAARAAGSRPFIAGPLPHASTGTPPARPYVPLSRTATMASGVVLPWWAQELGTPNHTGAALGSPAGGSVRRSTANAPRTPLTTIAAQSASEVANVLDSRHASCSAAPRTETHATTANTNTIAATTITTTTTTASVELPASPVVLHEGALSKQEAEACLNEVWQERPVPSAWRLSLMQLQAVLYRRFFYSLRDRRMLFFQIIIPVICILIAMLLQLIHNTPTTTVVFRPDLYGERTNIVTGKCASTLLRGNAESMSRLAQYGHGLDTIDWQDDADFSAYNLSLYLQQTWSRHALPRYVAMQCGDADMAPFVWARDGRPARGRLPYVTFYNTSSRHSLPYALHTMAEVIYRDGLARAGASEAEVANATFRMTARTLPSDPMEKRHTNTLSSLLVGLIVLIPFTFLPANPVAWVVKEKEIGARHLQKMTGLHYGLYWLGTFLFDFASYILTIVLVLAIFAMFRREEYVGAEAIGPFIVALLLYGLCGCTAAYVLSFLFREHTAAQMAVLGGSFLTGFLFVVLVFVLDLMPATQTASLVLRWVFRVVPSYAIGEVILNLALLSQNRVRDPSLRPWGLRVTGYADIYMAAEVPLWALVTLLWDHPSRPARVGRLWRRGRRLCCLAACCRRRRHHNYDKEEEEEACKTKKTGNAGENVNMHDPDGAVSQAAHVIDGCLTHAKHHTHVPSLIPLTLGNSNNNNNNNSSSCMVDGAGRAMQSGTDTAYSPLYPSQKMHGEEEGAEQEEGNNNKSNITKTEEAKPQPQQQMMMSSLHNFPTTAHARPRKASFASFLVVDDSESQHRRLRRTTTAAYAQLPRFVNPEDNTNADTSDEDEEADANVAEDERRHMQNYRFASCGPQECGEAGATITTVSSPPATVATEHAAHSQSVMLDTLTENPFAAQAMFCSRTSANHNNNSNSNKTNMNMAAAPGQSLNDNIYNNDDDGGGVNTSRQGVLSHLRRRGTVPPTMPCGRDAATRAGRPRLSLTSVRQPREEGSLRRGSSALATHKAAAAAAASTTISCHEQQPGQPATTVALTPARLMSATATPAAAALIAPLYPSPPYVKDWVRRSAAHDKGRHSGEEEEGSASDSEDSDVQEERLAVYEDERRWLAEHHNHHHHHHNNNNNNNSTSADIGHAAHHDDGDADGPDIVRMVDLCKVYPQRKKVAVQSVSFSVMHGEVFGFLGTNGAGKSTTISILTQEQLPTSGRAYVCGYDVTRESAAAMRCMGYCPQFDACFDLLTVEEHLQFYAAVRGVAAGQARRVLTLSLLKLLGLQPYCHVVARQLSGGNRRKLSVAIALLGAPRVVCLDEPSAGMDPVARRLLWRALVRIARRCSIILTTHYLEEVEALADCVGIMVDGKLRCIGDLPHLKHKYTRNAYELNIRLRLNRRAQTASASAAAAGHVLPGDDPIAVREALERFIEARFPSALLIENFNDERITYSIPATRDVAAALDRLRAQQLQRRHTRPSSLGLCTALSPHALRTPSHVFSETLTSPSLTTAIARIVRLSDIFEVLQDNQDALHISDFSVSQMSLEQVFLRVCANDEEKAEAENGAAGQAAAHVNGSTASPSLRMANVSHTRSDTLRNSIAASGLVQSGVRAFARLRRVRAARYTAVAQQAAENGAYV